MITPKKILYAFGICTFFLVSWDLPTTLVDTQIQPTKQLSAEDNIDQRKKRKVYKGQATYYHDKFHGRKTASGELYNKKKYTAAVRMNKVKIPFGTIIEVKNLSNNKKVRVKVNDKIPNSSSAIVDLSRVAAKEIGLIQAGRAKVEIRVVSKK